MDGINTFGRTSKQSNRTPIGPMRTPDKPPYSPMKYGRILQSQMHQKAESQSNCIDNYSISQRLAIRKKHSIFIGDGSLMSNPNRDLAGIYYNRNRSGSNDLRNHDILQYTKGTFISVRSRKFLNSPAMKSYRSSDMKRYKLETDTQKQNRIQNYSPKN